MSLLLAIGLGVGGAMLLKARQASAGGTPPTAADAVLEGPSSEEAQPLLQAAIESGLAQVAIEKTIEFVSSMTAAGKAQEQAASALSVAAWDDAVFSARELIREQARYGQDQAWAWVDQHFTLPQDGVWKFPVGATPSSWYVRFASGMIRSDYLNRNGRWLYDLIVNTPADLAATQSTRVVLSDDQVPVTLRIPPTLLTGIYSTM